MKRGSALLALLLAASCASAPIATGPRPGTGATLAVVAPAKRVILVSFDGLSADEIATFGAPSFDALPVRVARVTPVEPTATSVTHAAILTGAGPEKTGIASNQFHLPGTPVTEIAKGLETEIATDTIVDRARRAGKTVGCILFPFVDALSPRRTADWGLAWTTGLTYPRIIHLKKGDFHSDWLPPSWGSPKPRHTSFSPVMRARIEWSIPQATPVPVDLVAYDTTNDGARNYDSFYVETPAGESAVGSDRWFAISTRRDDGIYGSWSKLLAADPSLDNVRVYWGAIQHNRAYPESFRKTIEDALGVWPGEPDQIHARIAQGGGDGIDSQTFIEQVNRLSDYLTQATVLAIRQMPFDLLLSYQPIIDGSEHQFRIESEAQLNGTPENRATGEQVRRAAYAAFDRAVHSMRSAIDVSGDALVITGDHGLAPYDTEVRLNTILPENWRAYSNGNVANIYRFSEGADTESVVKLLSELRTPEGSPVFEKVVRRPPGANANLGDLVAFSFPRFSLSNASGELFARSASYGQHGGTNNHHEFQTTLGAAGSAVGVQRLDELPQTRIEPLVEQLLGLSR